jgi:hypothetical protein
MSRAAFYFDGFNLYHAIVACQNLDDFRSVQTSVQRIREVRS